MRNLNYDAIIVGARCAGATLATLLARAGVRVLVLDRDTLPSDHVLSTHTIHPPGIDVLDEVGVGEAMREVTPPSHVMRVNKNGASIDVRYAEGRAEYCPRRKRLDGLLQDAAVNAGAELLDGTRVTALLRENGRVVGVCANRRGEEHVFRAGLVIGADGRHSTVAAQVEAEEYLGYDAPRAMYWSYWEAPSFWRTDPTYAFGMYVGHVGDDIRVVFQTDDNLLLIGSLPPREEAMQRWRTDPEGSLTADLASDAVVGPLIAGARPAEKVRGTLRERYFFRQAAGPGWALVGDAGHHKEFVIGDGMTEALLQARSLAAAIAEGTDDALVRWWRARDVEALPLFFFGQDEGALGPPKELQRTVFTQLAKRPALSARMARAMEHQESPYDVLPMPNVLQWMIGTALRGNLRVLPEFLEMGKRASQVNREMKFRKAMLASVGGAA